MFVSKDFREWQRARPFKPFRIRTSTGETFDVKHPDQILVMSRKVVVPRTYDPDNPEFGDLETSVALLHVVNVEELSAASTPDAGSKGSSDG